MKFAYILFLGGVLAITANAADLVVPVDQVARHVNVRMEADAKSEVVGRLAQGDSLPLDHSIDGWHVVRLADGELGYISADWSIVIAGGDATASASDANDVEDTDKTDAAPDPESDVAVAETAEPGVEPAAAADVQAAQADTAPAADRDAESPDTAEPATETSTAATMEPATTPTTDTQAPDSAIAPEPVPPAVEQAKTVAVAPVVANAPAPEVAAIDEDAVVDATGPQAVRSGPAAIEGTVDYLMKFTASTIGGNSQVYDDGRNVGIGTSEPKQRLEVNGNIQIHERNSNVAGLLLTQSSGDTGYIMHNRANSLTLGAGSVDRMTIDRDGNVGIGMARPTQPLEMASGAHVTAGGVWTNSSSREKKDGIVSLTPEEAVATLERLEPVRYHYKVDDSEEYVGFIAEDVPELVATGDRKSLSPMDIVAVLTEVVQQQQQRIADLEARLEDSGL